MGEERTAFVVGASRGLGRAVAGKLLDRGWTVLAGVRTPAHLDIPNGRCIPVRIDLVKPTSIEQAAGQVARHVTGTVSGRLDALVLVAGITSYGAFEDTPEEIVREVFETNVFGPMTLVRALLPHIRRRGGHILVVSSEAAMYGLPVCGSYAASKAAVSRWTESLSHELNPYGVAVTILEPGAHATDMATLMTVDRPKFASVPGPYSSLYAAFDARTRLLRRLARSADSFGARVADILDDPRPPLRMPVGPDARLVNAATRFLPSRVLAGTLRFALGSKESRHTAAVAPPADAPTATTEARKAQSDRQGTP